MRRQKKKLTFLLLVFAFFACFTFSTIAYSAISSTMNISGDAYARVDADIRITSFKLSSSTSNGISHYEEYSKNTISSKIQLFAFEDVKSVTYDIEVTNYGNVDMGIFDITGLPSGLSYEIINYNLKDKLCDDTGKCNGMAKKTFQIKITGSPGTYEFVLNIDFRQYHQITYKNIDSYNYPKYVIDGGTLNVTFQEKLQRISILSNGTQVAYYDSVTSGQTISLNNITNDIEITKNPAPAKLISGSITEPGSLVCISDECFHVLSNDGSTVTLLARYNLLVGYYGSDSAISGLSYTNKKINPTKLNYILDEDYKVIQLAPPPDPYSSYELTNPTGIQDPTAKAWVITGFPYIGTTDYNSYETYYPTYKTHLEKSGISINNIRNIALEEIQNLGCGIGTSACPATLSWIYATTYWTSTAESHENYLVFTDNNIAGRYRDLTSYVGLRPVIEISITDIDVPSAKVISGDVDTPGAEVCIGNECFYTISSTTNTITMLSKYNLYVGGSYDGTTYTLYGEEATGKQDTSMYGHNPTTSISTGTLEYAPSAYWINTASYPTNVFNSNSKLYSHVMNYKNYLKSLGAIIQDSRLITFDELKSLGCDIDNKTCLNSDYSFVYSTSYWSGTAFNKKYIYRVRMDGTYSSTGYEYSNNWGYGVRPVITIPKSELYMDVNVSTSTIGNKVYKAIVGMTWREWVNSEYNTDGYNISGDGIKRAVNESMYTKPNGVWQQTYADEKIIPGESYILTYGGVND